MEVIKALILGIIEGITEFLPISSTAHLIVAEDMLNFKDTAEIFTVVVQLGAILAAAWYFRSDLIYIIRAIFKKDAQMLAFTKNVVIGILPAGIIGLIVEKTVGLPDSLWVISIALILGGIAFLVIESLPHAHPHKDGLVSYEAITTKRALLVGLGQVLSIIPGVSRSGATIMSGLLAGLDRKTATVFSFYLSIPIMLAASALKLIDDRSALSDIDGGNTALLIGVVSAFITACMVITWLLRYVTTNSFRPFAYYRIFIGTILLVTLVI